MDYYYAVPGDAYLIECGAHYPELKFWCFAQWPDSVIRIPLKHGENISIPDHIQCN